jgi:hypothetical protein
MDEILNFFNILSITLWLNFLSNYKFKKINLAHLFGEVVEEVVEVDVRGAPVVFEALFDAVQLEQCADVRREHLQQR